MQHHNTSTLTWHNEPFWVYSMYSEQVNVMLLFFQCCLYNIKKKTIQQLLMSNPVSAGRRGQTRVVWHFQHQRYKCNGGQKNLGQFEKLFQVNYYIGV